MNRETLEKKAVELGLDPSKFDSYKSLMDAYRAKKAEVSPVKEEKKADKKVEADVQEAPKQTVTLESADDQTLSCIVNNKTYVGKTIEVPVRFEKAIREILLGAGFLLK